MCTFSKLAVSWRLLRACCLALATQCLSFGILWTQWLHARCNSTSTESIHKKGTAIVVCGVPATDNNLAPKLWIHSFAPQPMQIDRAKRRDGTPLKCISSSHLVWFGLIWLDLVRAWPNATRWKRATIWPQPTNANQILTNAAKNKRTLRV